MSSSSSNDPRGWVQSPPTTFVQVVHTSQAALNHQFALVVAYEASKDRYIVVLTETQRQLALKPDNLQVCSKLEQFRAQYQMIRNSPEIQHQLRAVWGQVQRVAPFLRTPQQLFVGVGAILLVSFYLLGFSRTLLWLSFAAMVALVVGPIYTSNVRELLWIRIPNRLKVLLRQSQWPFANYIADRDYLLAGLVAVVLAVFVSGMLPRNATNATASASADPSSWMSRYLSPSSSSIATSPTTAIPRTALDREQQNLYKLGFDDATNLLPFGHSLKLEAAAGTGMPLPPRTLDETTLDLETSATTGGPASYNKYPDSGTSPVPPPTPRHSSRRASRQQLFSIPNLMTLAYTGNTLYQLGLVPGTNDTWNFHVFQRNIAVLPPWKLGLMALSLYRVVSSLW